MTSIDRIIQQEPNPFDAETFWSGNFWREDQKPELTVESIHDEAVAEIQQILDLVATDHRTRTLILEGETGSGKTYLLGRLKRKFNNRAFFAYIEPFTDSDYIWRHILRYTVDSLLEVPAGETEPQIVLWLKNLWAFKHRGILDWLRGERQMFINNVRAIYPAGIYNATEFFGVLHDLTNPKLINIACEWLRGDDLEEEDLKALRVQESIDTEDAAQKILANFGRISAETRPIILCFDQLDNIARSADGFLDLQSLFSANSVIHNQKLKNFLVIISIITDTWKQNANRVQPTDKDRIDATIMLKQISIDQAAAIWASRLYRLHHQATPQPESSLYPLTREMLDQKFPGGKTRPRNTLILGRQLFHEAKRVLMDAEADSNHGSDSGLSVLQAELIPPDGEELPEKSGYNDAGVAAFKLLWWRKFNATSMRIDRIRQYSSPELMAMLTEVLQACVMGVAIQPRLLPSRTYGSYSLSYQTPDSPFRVGVVWSEDQNMVKFFNLMKLCQEVIDQNLCQKLILIRAEGVGTSSNRGNQLYGEIFTSNPHVHLIPDLTSVYYLAAYHGLVNDAYAGDLIVGDRTPDIAELEATARQAQIFQDCPLLQDLGITRTAASATDNQQQLRYIEDFILSRVINQQCIARQRLISETLTQFSHINESQINQLISHLCQEQGQIKIFDPEAKLDEQLLYSTIHQ
ncbi:MAG TPA: ATP-binding protein [Oscillatoriaceae cyanobacterium M33_DOE_052]|uniref:ATP-binding protein n=1 Tax=Planktothricoides sp. SpSt-374 TaxID=2282167 RepID=A0A7C3VE56_9CYAN|nr:ATP-binding protein [Oscillatoriaceae cyanobacterium M33_DOE_052]